MIDLAMEYFLYTVLGLTSCWGPYCPPAGPGFTRPEVINRTVQSTAIRSGIPVGYRSNPGAGLPQPSIVLRSSQSSQIRSSSSFTYGGGLGGGTGDLGRRDFPDYCYYMALPECDPWVR